LFGFHLGRTFYCQAMMYRFILLCVLCAGPVLAQQDTDVAEPDADTPDGALSCAAARFRGEPLSLERDDGMFELRWLTPSQNVLRIKLTGPGCQFVEIRGVGLTEALILP
jgi:hypothetical protein